MRDAIGFAVHWLKNWREISQPIANPSNPNRVITFDSRFKTVLYIFYLQFSGPPISVILYEHSTRSDGSVDEVSIGYLLAKRGLAKFLDYEKAHIERLNKLDEDACESEDLGLRRNECGPGTASDISETYSLSETSTNSNLIDKILAVEMSSAPSPTSEQKPLVSLVLSNGSNDQSSILSSTAHIPISTISSTKGVENAEVSHDQGQATASSGHLTSSTSAVAESVITEVNQYSIESSV